MLGTGIFVCTHWELHASKIAHTCNDNSLLILISAESFVGKGYVIRGYRRHARMRVGKVEYKYCNYYVRLEEGKPPLNYYNKPARDRNTLLSEWMELMRNRRIVSSL